MAGGRRALGAFIEERSGLLSWLRRGRDAPLPGGPSLGRSLGVAVTILIGLQFATGIGLALFYSPSTTSAWASVDYLERHVLAGTLLRALHYQGTNVLLAVLAAHLLHTVLGATYRRPRELIWWLGLVLIGLVLATAMTGALLPWDEQGYWASRVEIGIIGTVPLAGRWLQQIALGGNDLGNLTLTRYYAVHAIVLPLLILATVAAQIGLARRHGAAPISDRRPTRYWPGQTLRDTVVACLALAAVFWLAARLGAPLSAPADPAGGFPARPAWYFRPLFELRSHFPGPLEPIATMLLPGLATAFLVALPFLDRAATRAGRAPYIGAVIAGMTLVALAAGVSLRRDRRDPAYQAQRKDALARVELARRAAAEGVPPAGALALLHSTPEFRGQRLFSERCAGCHQLSGQGTDKPKGPDFGGYLSHDWLVGVIAHPEAPEFFGRTKANDMDSYAAIPPEHLQQLAHLLGELWQYPGRTPDSLPKALKPGLDAFDGEGCASCHSLTAGEASGGPNLNGYGSETWLVNVMLSPGDETLFGKENDMPSSRGKVQDNGLRAIATYLRTLRSKPVQYHLAVAQTHP